MMDVFIHIIVQGEKAMRELEYPFDGKMILRKRKAIRKKLSGQPGLTEKRIAILGGSTTHDVREILEL